ncbi:hypothetical protein [Arthrobacter sp. Z4-13]
MSREVCRDWPGMIKALEAAAGTAGSASDAQRSGWNELDYARRAAQALAQLRLGHGEMVADSVSKALLEHGPAAPPPQTHALASLYWPLVLTTNYDDLYPAAVHEMALTRPWAAKAPEDERREATVQIVGRSSIDCHRVLSALSYPAPPFLWALQGYLGGQALIRTKDGSLSNYQEWVAPNGLSVTGEHHPRNSLRHQIVVGHADYRRVALRSEGFRRAFAEVFRSRTLLS